MGMKAIVKAIPIKIACSMRKKTTKRLIEADGSVTSPFDDKYVIKLLLLRVKMPPFVSTAKNATP